MGTSKAKKLKANLNILLIDVMVIETFLATAGTLSFPLELSGQNTIADKCFYSIFSCFLC
ncbi:hypothetical protein AWQ21_02910 [Picosynechococcus sp. PCC 7003]|nr:hypothetical protein AWQ21_02910 [Picosynechococcus sp. PCC 7003]